MFQCESKRVNSPKACNLRYDLWSPSTDAVYASWDTARIKSCITSSWSRLSLVDRLHFGKNWSTAASSSFETWASCCNSAAMRKSNAD